MLSIIYIWHGSHRLLQHIVLRRCCQYHQNHAFRCEPDVSSRSRMRFIHPALLQQQPRPLSRRNNIPTAILWNMKVAVLGHPLLLLLPRHCITPCEMTRASEQRQAPRPIYQKEPCSFTAPTALRSRSPFGTYIRGNQYGAHDCCSPLDKKLVHHHAPQKH